MISKEQLDTLGEAAQKYGIRTFKCPDFTVVFTDQRPQIVIGDVSPNRQIGQVHGMPTEDELLFASSIPLSSDEMESKPPHG